MSSMVIVQVQQRVFGSTTRKAIAAALADHASPDGTRVFPAPATVAAMAECSIPTVRREIGALVKMGILRLVKQGGRGPRSTNEYAFDLAALKDLPDYRTGLKKVDPDDIPEPVSAVPAPEPEGDDNAALGDQGDHLSEGTKVITDDALGDHSDHQTCKEPKDTPLPPTAVGEIEFVDFERFETVWPWFGDERRDTALSAWKDLDEVNRRSAIDHVPAYLAAWKAGRTRRKAARLQAAAYLRSRMWLNRKAAVPTVKRSVFAVKGSAAWAYALSRRNERRGGGLLSAPTHTTRRPADGAAVTGWNWPVGWFDGAELPDDVAAGRDRDWWIVETVLSEAAALSPA